MAQQSQDCTSCGKGIIMTKQAQAASGESLRARVAKTTGQRFAIFARVSTRDQLTGHSLEFQIAHARQYIERVGGTVVKGCVYSAQESASGGMATRDELQRLLADAERGLFDAVVIQETSRLSRNIVVMVQATERLVRAGVALHDFTGLLPIDTAQGKLTTGLMAVTGGYTADIAREKSRDIRMDLLKAGVPAAGRPPFGRTWNKEAKQTEIIPERREQIKRAYDLIVRQSRSMRFAAAQLEMGESSLRKAIRQAALTEFTQHLNGEEFTFPCRPLITAEKQQQLVQRLASNATVRPQSKNEYLLQGLVRCAGCGRSMSGQTSTKGGRSHMLYRHPVPATGEKLPAGCAWMAPVQLLDDDVLMACAAMIENGDALRSAIKSAIAQADSEQVNLAEHVADREHRIAAAVKKVGQQLDLAVETEKGSDAREQILAKIKRTERTLTDLRAEHAELSAQLAVVALPKGGADAIAAKLRSLYWHRGAGPAKMLPFAKRKEFVRLLVGRTDRESKNGVYVKMSRRPGAVKKDVTWSYELRGAVGIADGWFSSCPDMDDDPYAAPRSSTPEVRDLRVAPDGVKALASLAADTPGINPRYGKQSAKSKSRTRGSSGD